MKRIILSGGGTGGHIYPAVAVAEALKRRFGEQVELLFVGAEGRMEMEKIPALGYRIVGLPIAGLQRRMDWHNLASWWASEATPAHRCCGPRSGWACRP